VYSLFKRLKVKKIASMRYHPLHILHITKQLPAVICSVVALLCMSLSSLAHCSPAAKRGLTKPARSSALKSMSAPRLLNSFQLRDFGSHLVKFGRLSTERPADALFVQIDRERSITCLTAMSLVDGSVLWQRGTPNPRNFSTSGEIPIQVYDWNGDSIDDVIFYQNGQLLIAHGADGSILASIDSPKPYSIFIYQTTRFGGPAGIVLHGRESTTLLAPDLSVAWSQSNGFSHFPMELDANGDGDPELLAGYLLFDSAGQRLWELDGVGSHNDAADFADTNCDGIKELAIATSGKAALVTTAGEVLWKGYEYHSQHINVGSFMPGTCQKQIATIDRDTAGVGIMRLYDHTGKVLWQREGFGGRAMMSRIDNWIAGVPESLLLVFRTPSAPPTLYDGNGRIVARLPFPPSLKKPSGKANSYSFHFAQHFDYNGDGQEEIFISNERELWIYSNSLMAFSAGAPKTPQTLPNPRIFNSTFYIGMQ
jgi:hypothetical protein